MSAPWLHQVLAEHAGLNLVDPRDRDVLVDAIIAAIPKDVMVAAITESSAAVLRCQRTIPRIADVSREIGRNAAQSVLLMLEVDDVGDFADHATKELEEQLVAEDRAP